MKKIIKIFVILLIVQKSLQLDIECEFKDGSWGYIGDTYDCKVSKISNVEVSAIQNVKGSHLNGKSHADVKVINFDYLENLKYFPRNILEFFPKLIAIRIKNSNIDKISSAHLEKYTELEWITIANSKISSLPGDLFKFNKKLKAIWIYNNNHLAHVGEELFDGLKELQNAHFGWNKCISYIADTPEKIEKLKMHFIIKCGDYCPSKCSSMSELEDLKKTVESLKKNEIDNKKIIEELKENVRSLEANDTDKTMKIENLKIDQQKKEKDQKETHENLKNKINELELIARFDGKEKDSNVWFFS